jgi:hypothetical protein
MPSRQRALASVQRAQPIDDLPHRREPHGGQIGEEVVGVKGHGRRGRTAVVRSRTERLNRHLVEESLCRGEIRCRRVSSHAVGGGLVGGPVEESRAAVSDPDMQHVHRHRCAGVGGGGNLLGELQQPGATPRPSAHPRGHAREGTAVDGLVRVPRGDGLSLSAQPAQPGGPAQNRGVQAVAAACLREAVESRRGAGCVRRTHPSAPLRESLRHQRGRSCCDGRMGARTRAARASPGGRVAGRTPQ